MWGTKYAENCTGEPKVRFPLTTVLIAVRLMIMLCCVHTNSVGVTAIQAEQRQNSAKLLNLQGGRRQTCPSGRAGGLPKAIHKEAGEDHHGRGTKGDILDLRFNFQMLASWSDRL